MTVSIRMSDEDTKLIKDYARLHGITVSDFLRRAALEKIEDELDLRAAEKAYAEYLANPVTYSNEEIMKEFGREEGMDGFFLFCKEHSIEYQPQSIF